MADLTRLRLVSQGWNQVILNTPELWNYIEISPLTTRVEPFLTLSKQSLLHLRIDVDDKTMARLETHKALDAVFSCTERWRSYSLIDIRRWSEVSPNSPASRSLVPNHSLPALQVASLAIPFESTLANTFTSNLTLNAPALREIDIWSPRDVSLPESLLLSRLTIPGLERASHVDSLIKILTTCQMIERLSITDAAQVSATMQNKVMPALDMPALKELDLRDTPASQQLLSQMDAPHLQILTFHQYLSPTPFSLPRSLPSLKRVVFAGMSRLNAIRRAVAATPLSQELSVEIDAVAAALPRSATRTDFEHLRNDRSWLDCQSNVRWIYRDAVPLHLFKTWEEAHGMVPL
ncbi:hypothetical protein FRB90_004355 [Tulasnella sp. 427]|nr:hypothetical protein FRB90_004355 [Tulasnella sp. 427]